MISPYERLAKEYYKENCNRTCQAFRQGSIAIARALLDLTKELQIIEVGAGLSWVAQELYQLGYPLDNLLLTDISRGMPSWSDEWTRLGARLIVSPADKLSASQQSTDLIVALLGDPYNELSFWREAQRVLAPGGRVLFTAPSYEWASSYREKNEALFTMEDESQVSVPSCVLEFSAPRALAEEEGFSLIRSSCFRKEELQNNLSYKFAALSPSSSIVDGYLFLKRGSYE